MLLQMHGTGTPLGDPIETGAAVGAYLHPDRQHVFTLSSSKSAVGHSEPAAGENKHFLKMSHIMVASQKNPSQIVDCDLAGCFLKPQPSTSQLSYQNLQEY